MRSIAKQNVDFVEAWTERDLSAAAAAAVLERGYAVDDTIDELVELLTAGVRPILVGEAGVGKTAVIRELVCRTQEGYGVEPLAGRRMLQVSIARRAGTARRHSDAASDFEAFVGAVCKSEDKLALFFSDLHTAYDYDLESQVARLALTFDGPILAEAHPARIEAMLENCEALQERFMCLRVEEPSLARARRILRAWATHSGCEYAEEAIAQSLSITHRFLARTRLPRKAIDLLRHAAQRRRGERVTAQDVIDRFCAFHRTPRALVDPAVTLDLESLRTNFEGQVIGQPQAVRTVVDTIGVIKAGLCEARRPLGVFLFAGPAGVGKTFLAQAVAEFLFGDRERLVRLNMADFGSESAPGQLFGDSREYESRLRRGLLTQRLLGRPFGVLLLDEFEKAHFTVHDRFLQLVDEGAFMNAAGETVSCRSMIIIATTNAGAEVYRGETLGFGSSDIEAAVHDALDRHFRFELLNRFDRVICFHPLAPAHARAIVAGTLGRLEQRFGIAHRGITLAIDPVVVDRILAIGYDPQRGARTLNRTIERHVTTAVAAVIARDRPGLGMCIHVFLEGDVIVARCSPSKGSTAAIRETPFVDPAPVARRSTASRMQGDSPLTERSEAGMPLPVSVAHGRPAGRNESGRSRA